MKHPLNTTVLIYPELLTVPAQVAEDLTLPALSRLLSLAKESTDAAICPEQAILRQLGYATTAATALPASQARWQHDFGQTAPEFCVCADPVHMLADTDHARLMDDRSLQLNDSEADELLKNLNSTFSEDGFSFVRGNSGCWYLTGKDATMLDTFPTKMLVGRNVASFLPEGEQTAGWRRLMTEIQMLLHADPVNQHRTTRGQLTVNSLWIWGGGAMPERQGAPDSVLYSDDLFACGLFTLSGNTFHDSKEFSEADFSSTDVVLYDGEGMNLLIYEDYAAWLNWIKQTEELVFDPVLTKFKAGEIDRVVINAGNRRQFTIEKSFVRQIFSRTKPLAGFVDPKFVEPLEQ